MNSNLLLFPGKIRWEKKLFQSIFFVGLLFLSGFIKAQPGSSQLPAFVSTQVHSENKVKFHFYAPNAKAVKLNSPLATEGHSWMNCALYLSTITEKRFK